MKLAQWLYFIGFFFVLFGLFYPGALFIGLPLVVAGVTLYGYHYTRLLKEADKFFQQKNKKRGKKK